MNTKRRIKTLAKRTLPAPVHHWLKTQIKPQLSGQSTNGKDAPPVGKIDFGNLRRLNPVSREFGYDRGQPIDRYYIENFLARQAEDIQGRTLEIGEATYTRRFGGDRITKADVLHVVEGNPVATIVGDLTNADNIPSDAFDCVVLTQTLHLLYDMKTAMANLYRALKPGGILLLTVPGISQVVKCDWGNDWCWALTPQSARLLFEEFYPGDAIHVGVHGNVLAATSFLQGLAVEELSPEELDYYDDEYPVLITIRAQKPDADGLTASQKTASQKTTSQKTAGTPSANSSPEVGHVSLGSLNRLEPISREFGFDRGQPVDRYYIEQFLTRHTTDIQGRVLEIKEPLYTFRFGGDRVTKSDILHAAEGNPEATLVADLTQADHLPADTFDCIILTQTLQFIFDVPAAIKTLYRILKPGGVLLATVSGISQISAEDMERWGHYWSFTNRSTQRLLEGAFTSENIEVQAYGNVLSATAFLQGIVIEELQTPQLDHTDLEYQVIISARAVK